MKSKVVVVKDMSASAAVEKCLQYLEQDLCFKNLGQVLIKANLALPVPPDVRPETSSPLVIGALIKELRRRGVKRVLVGDEPAWGASTHDVFRTTGLAEIVKESGGEPCYFEKEPRQVIPVPDGQVIKEISLPKVLLDSDMVINLPKMKTSIMLGVSIGIKNLFGCITFEDRKLFHREIDLAYLLLDIYKAVKPAVTIVDAITAMEGYGAHLGDPVDLGLLIASQDVVAADAVSSYIMGIDPMTIPSTQVGVKQKLGNGELNKITCVGEDIQQLVTNFKRPNILAINSHDNVFVFPGGICPGCKPRIKAVPPSPDPNKRYGVIFGREPIAIPVGTEMDEWWLVGSCGIRAGLAYLAKEKYRQLKTGSKPAPTRIQKIPGCPPLEWYAENAIFRGLRERGWMTT